MPSQKELPAFALPAHLLYVVCITDSHRSGHLTTKRDKTIIEMIAAGESFNAISKKIWNGNSNGKRNKIIKSIIKKYTC
jgi:hypothetical protein